MRLFDDSVPSDAGGDGSSPFSGWKCEDCGAPGEDHHHFRPDLGGRCSVQGCPCDFQDFAIGIHLDGTPVTGGSR